MGLALILFKSGSQHLKVGPELQKSEVALQYLKDGPKHLKSRPIWRPICCLALALKVYAPLAPAPALRFSASEIPNESPRSLKVAKITLFMPQLLPQLLPQDLRPPFIQLVSVVVDTTPTVYFML